MRPDSSGSRSASSTRRSNSGSSSRNSTPPWASEISPGRGGVSRRRPAPAAEAVWCGAWNGTYAPARRCVEAAVERGWHGRASSASSSSIGGSRPGRRCASIDLPVPGGPHSSRLCRRPRRSPARAWPGLAAHVGRSGPSGRAASRGPARPRQGARRRAALRCRHHLQQRARRAAPAPATSAASAALAGQHQAARPRPRARPGHRQRAAHRPQLAGQRQLAGELVARRAAAGRSARRRPGCPARSAGRSGRTPWAGRPAPG
jgi:hypothetical protein